MTKKDKRVNFLLIIPLVLAVLLFIGATYALYEKTIVSNKTVNLTSGSRYIGVYGEDKDKLLLNNTYNFTIENRGVEDALYELYFKENDSGIDLSLVTYTLSIGGETTTGTLSSLENKLLKKGSLNLGKKFDFSITLESSYTSGESIRVYTRTDEQEVIDGPIFRKAYVYSTDDANKCITGDESTCQRTKCYVKGEACPAGTIVDYAVNDSQVVRFHVMFDENNTLIMQSQKNLISGFEWVSKEDYIAAGGTEAEYGAQGRVEKGPLTALKKVEDLTKDWSNVNYQTYTMGTTVFKTNAYVTCSSYEGICKSNIYTLPTRTAKARMITFQEALLLGCKDRRTSSKCPVWMSNFLRDYVGSGEIISEGDEIGYWTLSVTDDSDHGAYLIDYSRTFSSTSVNISLTGIRPVVVVNKQ